jgi:hypothetical protein
MHVGIFYYYNILVPTVHEKVYCRCHNPTFVTAKSDQNPDPHWFGCLYPDYPDYALLSRLRSVAYLDQHSFA